MQVIAEELDTLELKIQAALSCLIWLLTSSSVSLEEQCTLLPCWASSAPYPIHVLLNSDFYHSDCLTGFELLKFQEHQTPLLGRAQLTQSSAITCLSGC